jgi:hypothetical protein
MVPGLFHSVSSGYCQSKPLDMENRLLHIFITTLPELITFSLSRSTVNIKSCHVARGEHISGLLCNAYYELEHMTFTTKAPSSNLYIYSGCSKNLATGEHHCSPPPEILPSDNSCCGHEVCVHKESCPCQLPAWSDHQVVNFDSPEISLGFYKIFYYELKWTNR